MSMRPCVTFVKALALSASLGCGTGAPANAPDGSLPDGAAPDRATTDVGAMICTGDRWGQSAAQVEALVGCTIIDGNLSLTGNDLLVVELPRLTRIEGFLTVWGNPALTRASFLTLERIGGYLDVSSNAALATLELPALESVNQRELLATNDVVIRDNALPACQTDAIREQLAAHGIRDEVSIVADGASCSP